MPSFVPKKQEKSKRIIPITTSNIGWIPELKTRGPIIVPIEVPSRIVLSMVVAGRKVFEHNPINHKEKILLTTKNFDEEKFVPAEVPTEVIEPSVEAAPEPIKLEENPKVEEDVVETLVEEQQPSKHNNKQRPVKK